MRFPTLSSHGVGFRRSLAVLTTTAALSTGAVIAQAEPAPITGVETGTTSDHWVGIDATFNLSDGARLGLPAVRQLRAEMWEVNPPFEGKPLREVAAAHGYKTKEAYANAIIEDSALSVIAVQRSAEYISGAKLIHNRPYGDNCTVAALNLNNCGSESTATINGFGGWGNNLALNTESFKVDNFIANQWGHGELQALKAANGFQNAQNGHLFQFLNPDNVYMGFGSVRATFDDGITWTSGATTFGQTPSGAAPAPNQETTATLYRAALAGETPAKVNKSTLAQGVLNVPAPSKTTSNAFVANPQAQGSTGSSNIFSWNTLQYVIGIISALATIIGLVNRFRP